MRLYFRDVVRHGRAHWLDWVMVGICFIAAAIVAAVVPIFKRDLVILPVQEPDLHFPFDASIVPTWLAGVLAFMVPALVILLVQWLPFRGGAIGAQDLHHGLLALMAVHGIGLLIVNCMKVLAGRQRPNYYAYILADPSSREPSMSFPSGHSSVTFEGFVYLSLYLCGKLRVYNSFRPRPLWMLVVSLVPLAVPSFVAISRTMDYHHHFADILAGSVIGTAVAIAVYFHYYPALTAELCDRPKCSIADDNGRSSVYNPDVAASYADV